MSKNTRHTEASLCEKGHTHIVEGTLRYDPLDNKQKVTINTRGVDGTLDGNTREIATSDLHQCYWTVETKAALDAQKRSAKRQAKSQRKAAIKAQLAEISASDAEPVEAEGTEDAEAQAEAEILVEAEPVMAGAASDEPMPEAKPKRSRKAKPEFHGVE